MSLTFDHSQYMRHALTLAKRGLGRVAPNPAVGCILVKDNKIIGRGFTQVGGRPHAETMALLQAGEQSEGANVYVTLEPCAHTGETPPCAAALVKAQVKTVYIGSHDPDPRVSGRGVDMLRQAGIAVHSGILQEDCDLLNRGFFFKINKKRPFFTLKSATSADGKIAKSNGDSKWITGEKSRACGHMLRACHDAILVGVKTVVADNPSLDCRLEGLSDRSPVRLILDRRFQTPLDSKLVQTAPEIPTVILTEAPPSKAFTDKGVRVLTLPDLSDMKAVGKSLTDAGFTRVLVEGGGQVQASFIAADMADEIWHFQANKIIGEDGIPAFGSYGLDFLQDKKNFIQQENREIDADLLAVYRRRE